MSELFRRATSKSDPWKDAEAAAGHLKKDYPLLSEVLLGTPPVNGDSGRMPGSVRLFTNGQELKVCLSGREWLFDGYLVLPKEVAIIECIESELQDGRVGWSVASEQKNSSKKPTY